MKSYRRRKLNLFSKSLLGSLLLGFSYPTWSNGLMIPAQNATNLGTAYAGTASLAEDASTNFYNAAGLTRLCNEQIVAGGALVLPHTVFTSTNITASNGTPLANGSARAKDSAMIPWVHYARRIDDCWMFGLSLASRFGSRANYAPNSVTRYTTVSAKLITIDLAPSLAYKLTDSLSLGAGIDAVYGDARLSSQIGSGPVDLDGFIDNRATRWGAGFHAGILYEPTDCTRLGVNYRSRVKLRLKGQNLTQPASVFPITSQTVRTDLRLPESVTLSAFHAFDDCWAVMADAEWFHWKLYDKLVLRFDDGTISTLNQYWKDSYRVAVGGSYQFCPDILFRTGISYDKTPTRPGTRPVYFPEENQVGIGIGGQYRFSEYLAFDIGYNHIFAKRATVAQGAPINIGGPPVPAPLQNLQGSVRRGMDIFGLQATWDLM